MEKSVTINLDERSQSPYGGRYGAFRKVYASRPGLATYTVRQVGEILEATLVWDTDNFREDDYLIVHTQRNPSLVAGSSRREEYQLLEGNMPVWADFPGRYHDFVSKYYDSARESFLELADSFAKKQMQSLCELIQWACGKQSKNRIASAWETVAKELQGQGLLNYVPERRSYSWTAVKAQPLRLLRALKRETWSMVGIKRPGFLSDWPRYQAIPQNIYVVVSPSKSEQYITLGGGK